MKRRRFLTTLLGVSHRGTHVRGPATGHRSTSWSSTSRLPKPSGSPFRPRCWPAHQVIE